MYDQMLSSIKIGRLCWEKVAGEVTPEQNSAQKLAGTKAYPSTSLTLRDRLCRLKGFCRNAVPLSMEPSLTIASSV